MNIPKTKIDSVINVWRRNKTKIGDDVIKVKYFGFFSLLLFGNFDLIYYTVEDSKQRAPCEDLL